MFRGGGANPYDDIVVKTTDENLTSENWELIMNLCDKVQDEGEQGARNVIAAILKRLTHRNANVQLYALALAEALTKNCGIQLHREIASRAFTQALEKLITDRTTHDKVRTRALSLIALWTAEWENDASLGIMEECFNSLKAKNYRFDTPQEPPPPEVDDEVRRREEEELQRALEISVQDKGGRAAWGQYSLASASGAGGSSSRAGYQPAAQGSAASSSSALPQTNATSPSYPGYAPSNIRTDTPSQSQYAGASASTTTVPGSAVNEHAPPPAGPPASASPVPSITSGVVTRVRALHTFEPSEPGELAFDKGDIIKVVDRGYKDWWRGQLKGRTGIFPVNYVEPLPEPTPSELAAEAQQESAVFAQAANVDRLLTMLRTLDPAKDNLADNEEIQELYRASMALRPKIVKLIDKYSQKRADLVAMNESFVKARTIFDRMMEDSLARHSGYYDQRPPYMQSPSSYQARPGSAQGGYGRVPQPQSYGWNPSLYEQPGYNAYPAPAAAYPPGQEGPYPPQAQPSQSYEALNSGGYPVQQPQQPPPVQGVYPQVQPYGGQGYPPAGQAPYPNQVPQPEPVVQQPDSQLQSQPPQQAPHPQPHAQLQSPQPHPHAQLQSPHSHPQTQPQPQPQQQPQPQVQPQPQQQPQPQVQPHSPQQQTSPQQQGPPYVFDPNQTYHDPNVQAWAHYYAQGGKDKTGAVYFLSVPGVTDGPAPPQPAAPPDGHPIRGKAQQSDAQPDVQAAPAQQHSPTAAAAYQPYPHQQNAHSSSELANWAGQQQPPQGEHVGFAAPNPAAAFTAAIQQQQQQHQPLARHGSVSQPTSPGAGPAPAPGYAPPYGAPPPQEGWQSQYQGLPGQIAGMRVGGNAPQGAPPGQGAHEQPQGVGA